MEDLRTERKGKILAAKDLPTLPKALEEVSRLVEDPNSSTEQIADVIAYDQVLSAKILKMVNSPIYGFSGRISSINHALVLLGFNVLKGVIISTSVFDVMNQNMKGLWEHSIGCAGACKEIANLLELDAPEEFAVSGLLHDLGKVVASVQFPDLKAEIENLVTIKDLGYRDAEREVMGFGHDMVNQWLATHWKLPPKIKTGMSHHHKPSLAEHYEKVACVTHLGDFFVRLFGYGFGGDDQIARLDLKALTILDLDEKGFFKLTDGVGLFLDSFSAFSFD